MPAVSLSSTLNVRKPPIDAQQRDEADIGPVLSGRTAAPYRETQQPPSKRFFQRVKPRRHGGPSDMELLGGLVEIPCLESRSIPALAWHVIR